MDTREMYEYQTECDVIVAVGCSYTKRHTPPKTMIKKHTRISDVLFDDGSVDAGRSVSPSLPLALPLSTSGRPS